MSATDTLTQRTRALALRSGAGGHGSRSSVRQTSLSPRSAAGSEAARSCASPAGSTNFLMPRSTRGRRWRVGHDGALHHGADQRCLIDPA